MIRRATIDDANAIGTVHMTTWRTAYVGLMPQHILDNLSIERSQERWRNRLIVGHDLIFVAEADSTVVGFIHGGAERTGKYPPYTSEITCLYLLQAYQRRGLGRQLVATIAHDFAPQHSGLLLWMLQGNPAQRFYEAIGGTVVAQQTTEIYGELLAEIGYGWTDWALLR